MSYFQSGQTIHFLMHPNQTFILRFLYSSVWKNVGITKDDLIIRFLDVFNVVLPLFVSLVLFQASQMNGVTENCVRTILEPLPLKQAADSFAAPNCFA